MMSEKERLQGRLKGLDGRRGRAFYRHLTVQYLLSLNLSPGTSRPLQSQSGHVVLVPALFQLR